MSTFSRREREILSLWVNGEPLYKISEEYKIYTDGIRHIINWFFIRECLGWKGNEETMKAMIRKALDDEYIQRD